MICFGVTVKGIGTRIVLCWVEWFSKCLSDVGFGLRGFHLGNYSLDIVQARTDPGVVVGGDDSFKGIKRLKIWWVLKLLRGVRNDWMDCQGWYYDGIANYYL